jgi:hypothetical protein
MFSTEPQEIFFNGTHGVRRQDKKPRARFDGGVSQPLTAVTEPVSANGVSDNRQKRHGSETRQTEQISGRVPFHIKTEVGRLADVHGWTESYTVRTLVEQALAHNLGEKFAVMIRNTIQEAVKTEIQKDRDWQRKISMSNYLASEQGRLLGIEHLRSLLGPEEIGNLPTIIANSQSQSLENLPLYFYSIGLEAEQSPWPSSK